MSFYVITTMLFGFGFVICCILLYVNKQEYLKNIGNKEVTIIRLTKENDKLNRIFDNYKFYKSKEYISELVESNIERGCEISKLNKEIKLLHNVIKNNNYDINKHHDSINYIANNKYALYKIDGIIYMTEGYTDDITKAKNFIKDNNQYYEVKRKDN